MLRLLRHRLIAPLRGCLILITEVAGIESQVLKGTLPAKSLISFAPSASLCSNRRLESDSAT